MKRFLLICVGLSLLAMPAHAQFLQDFETFDLGPFESQQGWGIDLGKAEIVDSGVEGIGVRSLVNSSVDVHVPDLDERGYGMFAFDLRVNSSGVDDGFALITRFLNDPFTLVLTFGLNGDLTLRRSEKQRHATIKCNLH